MTMVPSIWHEERIVRLPRNPVSAGWSAKLEEKFLGQARPGEPILVVMKTYQTRGCGGRDGYFLETHMYMGILPEAPPFSRRTEPENFLMERVEILVPRYFVWYGNEGYYRKEEPIDINLFFLGSEDSEKPLYSPYEGSAHLQKKAEEKGERKPDYPVEIIVGHGAIQTYAVERGNDYVNFYIRACKELAVRHPVKIEAIVKHEFEVRSGILKSIMNCRDKISTIEAEVEKIFRIARSGSSVYSPDGLGLSITLCEDDDDARIITMGHRNHLQVIHRDLRRLLEKALELEMDSVPWKMSFPETPGLTLDVPMYIRWLAGKLKVERNR